MKTFFQLFYQILKSFRVIVFNIALPFKRVYLAAGVFNRGELRSLVVSRSGVSPTRFIAASVTILFSFFCFLVLDTKNRY